VRSSSPSERGKRRRGDLGGDQHGLFGHGTAALGERHRAAAAVLRVGDRSEEAARRQPVDHALDGGGVEADVPAEMVLRSGAEVVQFGERGELGLRQPLDHARGEDRGVRCMATRSRKPTYSSST
jgi:hypothetical protein